MQHSYEIKKVTGDKRLYLNLLLIGDEQEDMIERYLDRSHLFIGYLDGHPVACCAITFEENNIIEIKNLAVLARYRRKGIGRGMLRYVEQKFLGHTFILGTGETPSTLRFYKSCGYGYSHRIPDFFTNNYDQQIIEEGVILRDMIYLVKKNSGHIT